LQLLPASKTEAWTATTKLRNLSQIAVRKIWTEDARARAAKWCFKATGRKAKMQ